MLRSYLFGSSLNKVKESGPADVEVPISISEPVEIVKEDVDCHMDFVGAQPDKESVSKIAKISTFTSPQKTVVLAVDTSLSSSITRAKSKVSTWKRMERGINGSSGRANEVDFKKGMKRNMSLTLAKTDRAVKKNKCEGVLTLENYDT